MFTNSQLERTLPKKGKRNKWSGWENRVRPLKWILIHVTRILFTDLAFPRGERWDPPGISYSRGYLLSNHLCSLKGPHKTFWSLELSGTVLNFHELHMTATQSLYHKRTLICGSYSSNALLHCKSFLKLKMVFAKLYPQYFTQVAHPQKCRIFENIRGTDLHLIWLTCSTSGEWKMYMPLVINRR